MASWPVAPRAAESDVQVGIASWYGPGFHGKRTSNGERYDQHAMTAAHLSLPLGSRILVTNLDNGRSVEVRVNDRGPFVEGRILDLSYAAARSLDLVRRGTAPVSIERLADDDLSRARVVWSAQAGAFLDDERARTLRRRLAGRFERAYILRHDSPRGVVHRVRVGPYADREAALARVAALGDLGLRGIVVEELMR